MSSYRIGLRVLVLVSRGAMCRAKVLQLVVSWASLKIMGRCLKKSIKQLNRVSIRARVRVSFRVSIRLSAIKRFSFVQYRPIIFKCSGSRFSVTGTMCGESMTTSSWL